MNIVNIDLVKVRGSSMGPTADYHFSRQLEANSVPETDSYQCVENLNQLQYLACYRWRRVCLHWNQPS